MWTLRTWLETSEVILYHSHMKKTIRWSQVYETEVDLPAEANINNVNEFSDQLDFPTHIEGAVQQPDTFELLDVIDYREPDE